MHLTKKTKAGLAAVGAAALAMSLSTPAFADVQPSSADAVAVGSDTVQYLADFGADGKGTLLGYNSANTSRRVLSFDATADASGRAAYTKTGAALNPTVILQAGQPPVVRPNGSSAGITAIINDNAHAIDFVRSSRLPSAADNTNACNATSFGGLGLHTYQIADDELQIAVNAASTHAPTAGLTAVQLIEIYASPAAIAAYNTANPSAPQLTKITNWSQIPGATGSNNIIAVIPQSGSGTRNDFLASLRTSVTPSIALADPADLDTATGGNVVTGEEHDPTGVTAATSPADAISPFSTGRDNLIDTGYFGTTPAPNTINLLPTTGTSYHLDRHLYFIARQTDAASTTRFQATSATNLVNTLFGTATSWYARPQNSGLISAAGVTQHWIDLGANTCS